MLDPYTFTETLRMERQMLAGRQERQAIWMERMTPARSRSTFGGVRRRLAQVLLVLADRLDPRGVVSVTHVPGRPALNGTLHHA